MFSTVLTFNVIYGRKSDLVGTLAAQKKKYFLLVVIQ